MKKEGTQLENPFIKVFQEFLEECAHEVDFTNSEEYREVNGKINSLIEKIELLLGENKQLITDLSDYFSGEAAVIVRTLYKKGFSAAMQLIFYSLLS